MKSKKFLSFIIASMMMLTLALSGCGSKEPSAPSDKVDADQTVNLVGYDYSSLDPSAESDAESFTTFSNVYEGLVREVIKDGVDTVELAGASDMKVSADGKVYTFTIRDSKWSDGQPVKAQDYVFSWKRLIDPKNGYDYGHFLDGVKGVEEYIAGTGKVEDVGIKAVNDKTLEVTLKEPMVFFDKMLVFKGLAPQREDIFKKLGDKYGQDYKQMVYNGPFIVSEYQKGSKIVYTKNEQYWDAKNVKLKTANGFIVEEPTTLLQMFKAKQLDQMGASTADILTQLKQLASGGDIDHIQGNMESAYYYIFNTQKGPLANKDLRLALSLGFDRQQQIDVLWQRHIPAYGIVPPGMSVGDKDYRKTVPDPLKALVDQKKDPKEYLNAALKALNIADASQVKLLYLTGQQTTSRKAQAEYIQKVWKDKLGITLDIKYSVDSPTYFTDRTKGNFDVCFGGWGADFNDVFTMLEYMRSGNGNNNGKYSNKAYDDAVNKAASEKDPAKRLEYFKTAENLIVVQDAAVAPCFYQDIQTFRYKYVKNMMLPLFGGYYELKNVYVSGK